MSFNRQPLGQRVPSCVSETIRSYAREQTCALRSPVCNHRPETTVHCHLRMFGAAGMGHKPHDFHGIHACSDCHRLLDSRDWMESGLIGFEDILRALMETQRRLYAAGLLRAGSEKETRRNG